MVAIPAYYGKGTANSGTGVTAVDTPDGTSHPARRLLICAIHTQNQPLPSITDRNGGGTWTLIPGADVNNGVAGGTAGAVRGYLYWKWGSATSDALNDGASLGDSGDHQYGHIFAFDNVDPVDPFGPVATSVQAATTAAVMPGVTTDEDESLVCYFTFLTRDASSTANLSAQANAALVGVTEQHDQSTATALGGGICLTTGRKAVAGASGDLTATAVSQAMAHITVALNPADNDYTAFETSKIAAEVILDAPDGLSSTRLDGLVWLDALAPYQTSKVSALVWLDPETVPPSAGRRRQQQIVT